MAIYEYRHNPYVINAYQFLIGGEGDICEIDFVSDRKQGFGVPARSIVIYNLGGGNGGDYLHFQYSSDNLRFMPEVSLFEGMRLIIDPRDGIYVSNAKVWADSDGLQFTLVATPGVWTDQELIDLGYIHVAKEVPAL